MRWKRPCETNENSSVIRNTKTNTNLELHSPLWDKHKYKTNYYTEISILTQKQIKCHTHPCKTVSVKSPMTIDKNPISLVQILTSWKLDFLKIALSPFSNSYLRILTVRLARLDFLTVFSSYLRTGNEKVLSRNTILFSDLDVFFLLSLVPMWL